MSHYKMLAMICYGPGRYEMLEFTLENACNKIKFPMIYAMPHVRIYESLVHRDI